MNLFPFAEVITDETSQFCKIQNSDFKSTGKYKIIDQGKGEVAGYTDDDHLVNFDPAPVIIFGDHTKNFKYVDFPIALGADGAKALRVNSKIANDLYIFLYLNSIKLPDAGYSRHFKFLKEVKIPLPPLDDQKRIAHLLGKVEGLIAQRKQHLKQLDSLLKSVFLEMFGDPVRNEKVWENSSIGTHVRVISGFAFKSDDYSDSGVPIIRISNLTGDSINTVNCARIPLSKVGKGAAYQIVSGDTLIAMSGATTGKLGFVPDDLTEDWYLNQRVGLFRIPKGSKLSRAYLRALLASDFYQNHVLKLAWGAAQPNISSKQLESAAISLPPLPLQNQFAAIVEKIDAIKNRYQQSLADLESLYGTLSQKAFAGELDLSRVAL